MPGFAIVVAADQADGIGKDGQLPWRLAGDMAFFKKLTTDPPSPGLRNAVVMGRKTWDSIPDRFRPLPERINVVISRRTSLRLAKDVIRAANFDRALAAIDALPSIGRTFVIGGGEVFREAIQHPELQCVYLTRVHATLDCDTFLAPLPQKLKLVSRSDVQREGSLTYDFCRFE
jgi:dihydrofolate reductase/thymidylate synthase